MKRKFIIFVNITALLLIYLCFECFFYYKLSQREGEKFPVVTMQNKVPGASLSDRFIPYDYSKTYKKKPILMIGCSYTYGERLASEDSPSAILAGLTGRHVYNWGVSGHGLDAQVALFQGQRLYKYISEPPEYVIYTYMFHHPLRFWSWKMYDYLRKADLIPSQPYNFLYHSFIWQYKQDVAFDKLMHSNPEFAEELFYNTMKYIKNQSDELFPGSKFIVLIYSDVNKDLNERLKEGYSSEEIQSWFDMMYSEKLKKKFEDTGISVIYTRDLIGRKMERAEDRVPSELDPNHPHPSKEAWSEILPALVKKTNM